MLEQPLARNLAFCLLGSTEVILATGLPYEVTMNRLSITHTAQKLRKLLVCLAG